MKVIIHDLGDEITDTLEKSNTHSIIFQADHLYAPCRGCFQCWLKNPGFCVMKDSLQAHGSAYWPE